MDDYRQISVNSDLKKKLLINNPTNFVLIGQGSQGAIFKLDNSKCIKVYESEAIAEKERNAYTKSIGSPIMPMLYEIGYKYLIIEYVKGPNLKEYLINKNELPMEITKELIKMFYEMKRLKFLRRDESLRHILINDKNKLKLVDHVYAYSLKNPLPIKLFRQLNEIDMLNQFIEQGHKLAPELFQEFRNGMPEFF
jgi:RIO-like serine/threonine protein kinase